MMDASIGPDANYVSGTWVAVAGPGCWLLIDLPPTHPIVNQCWQLVSDGAATDDLLDVFISGGIRLAPNFALARSSAEERRVLARGTASVTVRGAGHDDVELAAFSGATWADEPIGEWVESLLLTSNQPSVAAVELPMSAGVTMASSIQVRVHQAGRIDAPVSSSGEPSTGDVPMTSGTTFDAPVVTAAEGSGAEPIPADEVAAPSYDYLFGATQRPPTLEAVVAAPASAAEPPQHETAEPTEAAEQVGSPSTEPSLAGSVSNETASWSTLPPPSAPSGLIDVVPWLDGAESPALPSDLTASARQPPRPTDAPAQAVDEPPTEAVETVNRSSLLGSANSALVGPTVLAAYCRSGHLSPAHAPQCRVCGAVVPAQQGFEIARPVLGVLRMSNGDVVTLDRGVILGRAPELPSGDDRDRPNVLRLASPENDISRNHAEVVLDGWHVYVRDLGSTNGTVITLPGQQPTRLRQTDMHPIEPGTIVSLADETAFVYEVTG
jgi:hypothetical protein